MRTGVRIAKMMAEKSSHRFKVGCVFISGGKIVGMGFNKNKTHPISDARSKTIHAELDALLDSYPDNIKKSTAYVVRVLKSGEMAMSKPCSSCEDLLRNSGARDVYYINRGGSIEKLKL